MKKQLIEIIFLVIVVFVSNEVLAVPPGKVLTWNTGTDQVVFDGRVHAAAGLACADCHDKLFQTRKGAAVMRMKNINEGQFCGKCHNGKKAFNANDPNNCSKCHRRPAK